MPDGRTTNQRMKDCQRIREPEKVIGCLVGLFSQTNDGWVAFNIGQEYEKSASWKRRWISTSELKSYCHFLITEKERERLSTGSRPD